jgi:hypothetical protein
MRRASQYCFLERHIGFGPHLDFPFFDSEPKRDAANEQHPAFEGERTNECVMDGEARADNKHTSDKKTSASSPECSSTGWPFWIFRLAWFLLCCIFCGYTLFLLCGLSVFGHSACL